MSYNIDSVDTLVLEAWMDPKDIILLCEKDDDEGVMPQICFIKELEHDAKAALKSGATRVNLKNFWWYGEGSGRSYDFLVNEVAPVVKGEVDAIFFWEGGDSICGLSIKDGKVAKCEVEMSLIKPMGW